MSAPTTASAPQPFDVCGRLPSPARTTLLEASAGTGKTWTIGALVTRYVAEGHARLDELLVITFSRAASQELRERVRAQLVEAEPLLGDPGAVAPDESPFLALLLDVDAAERAVRHRRIVEALADFDAATVVTTHQFCAQVLDSLGVAGDSDPRARLVEDLDEVVEEAVDDLYLRKFAYPPDDAPARPFTRDEALALARAVVADPQAQLEPTSLDGLPAAAAARVSFARAVRAEVELRKRRLGLLSYDDLLSQLADALRTESGAGDGSAPARDRMRRRWSIVLVDEFQDTDPVQWEVLDRAFTDHATMVLIGDPKQAVYAFRGGDVDTYLRAAATATEHFTLAVNWRSDAGLVACLEALLDGAELGDERIRVRPVTAHHQQTRLVGAQAQAPLRMRVVLREGLGETASALVPVGRVRPHVVDDLARDVRRLLTGGATFEGRPIEPADVAVICYKNSDLHQIRAALAGQGVPAVVAGAGSVFATPAAVEWLSVLEALEQPHRAVRVRSAALTCFVGLSAAELDAGGDDLTDRLAEQLRRWAGVAQRRGIAAVLELAVLDGLVARVLARIGGERLLTDLKHIGETLHQRATEDGLGVVALLAWLREQVREAAADRGTERTRRLDSDAAAVQLVTIHGSKGLQYPVVYLPTLADRWVPRTIDRPLFHDRDGVRCLDVGGAGPEWSDHVARAEAEAGGEWLRLLYVAITRAQSQVVCWWAPTANAKASPLHRLLSRDPHSAQVPAVAPVPDDPAVVGLFARWRDAGALSPEPAVPAEAGPAPEPARPGELAVRRFDRDIDPTWRRTSYSALSHVEDVAATPAVGSEPEVVPRDDEEPVVLPPEPAAASDVDHLASPMAGLPVGATFGSLVHAVLEHADPQAPDLAAELGAHVARELTFWPVAGLDVEQLVTALVAVCDSPLGPAAPGLTLRDLARTDRLCELDFELPLAGGDRPVSGPAPRLGDLAPLLRAHLPEGDPVRGYADALATPALGGQSLRGYLTGSVDLVLRVPDGPAHTRYLVVDYKTNWLGPREAPLTTHAYRPEALAAAMEHSDYPLQALLYAVVLHRFLRWRQPGYDPARHLGGVLYLYLRGMAGPETPVIAGEPCGVFTWRPPVALVEAVSDLLDGATSQAPARRPRAGAR